MGCFAAAGGCGSEDSTPGGNDSGAGGGPPSSCSTNVVVKGCNSVEQNGQVFDLGCSSIVNRSINGRAVCAGSGQCVGTAPSCLDPSNVYSCLQNCRPQNEAGADAAASPLGTSCASTAECGGGLTCLKPSDNIVPGAGPPNGLCTADCTTAANQNLCKSLGGICVALTAMSKAFCMEPCTEGKVGTPESKCHGRHDSVCSPLDTPGSFACVPICETDADCGTRKCDLGTGLCADVLTPGSPIGSSCLRDSDCAGLFCYPFESGPDASSSAGVCTAICRLGNVEACGFRTSPLDAGPPVGACLLASSSADVGDIGICAQLCDTVNDCGSTDSRWNCILDSDVRTAFGHAGYCWLGARPGPRDASAPDTAPETGAPETGAPEPTPEAGPEPTPESGVDVASDVDPDGSSDGSSDDGSLDALPD
jgi:hypothetical protein